MNSSKYNFRKVSGKSNMVIVHWVYLRGISKRFFHATSPFLCLCSLIFIAAITYSGGSHAQMRVHGRTNSSGVPVLIRSGLWMEGYIIDRVLTPPVHSQTSLSKETLFDGTMSRIVVAAFLLVFVFHLFDHETDASLVPVKFLHGCRCKAYAADRKDHLVWHQETECVSSLVDHGHGNKCSGPQSAVTCENNLKVSTGNARLHSSPPNLTN